MGIMKSNFFAYIAWAALFAHTAVAKSDEISASCTAPQYRQFDFWIGEWNVFDEAGKKLGDSRIERINQGCGLLENWSGASGSVGKSLNMYDVADHLWHQFWIDNQAGRLTLDGKFADGKMILAATAKAAVQRITWTQKSDGSVRQLWETSKDGGKTWTTSFDGRYVKKTG
jgi:hypothetical protein